MIFLPTTLLAKIPKTFDPCDGPKETTVWCSPEGSTVEPKVLSFTLKLV